MMKKIFILISLNFLIICSRGNFKDIQEVENHERNIVENVIIEDETILESADISNKEAENIINNDNIESIENGYENFNDNKLNNDLQQSNLEVEETISVEVYEENSIINENIENNTDEQVIENIESNLIQETEKDETIEKTKVEENSKTEEYRYNSEMTQRLIEIINNNPSDMMLQNDFNVIEDKSILELTNQFTFSEKRVKAKIKNLFGTIRVYAQDYYLNDSYIATECYIF